VLHAWYYQGVLPVLLLLLLPAAAPAVACFRDPLEHASSPQLLAAHLLVEVRSQCLTQPHGGGALALTQGCWGDAPHHNCRQMCEGGWRQRRVITRVCVCVCRPGRGGRVLDHSPSAQAPHSWQCDCLWGGAAAVFSCSRRDSGSSSSCCCCCGCECCCYCSMSPSGVVDSPYLPLTASLRRSRTLSITCVWQQGTHRLMSCVM
jgi:hypothetical protein